jgi:mono/diheme cytochrome c family protein/cytochrome c1
MAATDQTYRKQKTLDVVFGVSCVLMLVSIVWMFADDYSREWKKEQRVFRDVEEEMSKRAALDKLPTVEIVDAERELERAKDKEDREGIRQIEDKMNSLRADLVKSDDTTRAVKAKLDSRRSFYDIEVQDHGKDSPRAQQLKAEIEDLEDGYGKAKAAYDANKAAMEDLLRQRDEKERPRKLAEGRVKKLKEDFDIQVETAKKRHWYFNDWFRSLPVIDAFNSPLRIQQFTLNDLPIDYNFKHVTRFDRCTTCHLGIDRPGYDKEALTGLGRNPIIPKLREVKADKKRLPAEIKAARDDSATKKKELRQVEEELKDARDKVGKEKDPAKKQALETKQEELTARQQELKEAIADLEDTLARLDYRLKRLKPYQARLEELADTFEDSTIDLSDSQVKEFCAHPRLDLFVSPTSPHAAEKFGCTSCHSGQGSATSFTYAAHTPNDAETKERWLDSRKKGGLDWEPTHLGDWEYPMLPQRFIESSCLKCHHQITDLIREGNRNEAPKLVRGYNLVRENGCFGCHEISGTKGGRVVGPDLRLEPTPALDQLSHEEQVKAQADPLNLPGAMRKVGPSLYRLSEKTHAEWVKRWIKSPRSFRPTTRMPHFFGLSNNDRKALKGTGQENFPDAEIESIAHYLLYESTGYTENIDTARRTDFLQLLEAFQTVHDRLADLEKLGRLFPSERARWKELQESKKNRDELTRLLAQKAPADLKNRKAWRKETLKEIKKIEENLGLVGLTPGAKGKVDDLLQSDVLNAQEKKDLAEVKRRLELRGPAELLAEKFKKSQEGANLPDKSDKKALFNGRRLFTERGCLACHSHKATTEEWPSRKYPSVPATYYDPTAPKDAKLRLPAIDREKYFKGQVPFGPNLSMLKAKFIPEGAKEDRNIYDSARRWLIQWILEPTFHSSRTLMPYTHLTFAEAADVATWLLAQEPEETDPDWKEVQVPAAKLETLKDLANVYLKRALTDADIRKLLDGKYDSSRVKDLALDERELAELVGAEKKVTENALKWYIGKKAISRQGCFGCHNIPGFDQAKPIGTPLNDWGKKDPERMAFEDIAAYLKDHYQVVDDLKDYYKQKLKKVAAGKKKPEKQAEGNPPYERFYAERLSPHHETREGFLHQKLREPRSYDYNRLRVWDDRLRMPQFNFSRSRPVRIQKREGETEEAYVRRLEEAFYRVHKIKPQPTEGEKHDFEKKDYKAYIARLLVESEAIADKEEAEAREAVMTFILGLVAEPIPDKFINQPTADRRAEVKGRQVLDKYNCAGCHLVQPGIYDFKRTADVLDSLATGTKDQRKNEQGDYWFPEHNAWRDPTPLAPDRVTVRGVYKEDAGGNGAWIKLAEAVRYLDAKGTEREIRGFGQVNIPWDRAGKKPKQGQMTVRAEPLGGHFSNLLLIHLGKVQGNQLNQSNFGKVERGKDEDNYENAYSRASGPPPLLREGEKVQPDWLFKFLRDPEKIRVLTVLRMPRFNMSEDEARALVNYFAAGDRLKNPGIGLTYPYVNIRQREEGYLGQRTAAYVKRLRDEKLLDSRVAGMKLIWDQIAEDERKEAEDRVAEAKLLVKQAQAAFDKDQANKDKVEALKNANDNLTNAENRLKEVKAEANPAKYKEKWKASEAYATEGYRLLTDLDLCRKCHQLGSIPASQLSGPPLHKAQDRLRPDWVKRWIANPKRFQVYTDSIMPPYFPTNKKPDIKWFVGSPEDQVEALRDVLMNFRKVAEMPANRTRPRPAAAGGEK